MNGKIDPKDNSSNQQNANKGTPGTNRQYDQVQGNRSKQLSSQGKTQSQTDSGKTDTKR